MTTPTRSGAVDFTPHRPRRATRPGRTRRRAKRRRKPRHWRVPEAEDPELAAYNDYLAALARQDRTTS